MVSVNMKNDTMNVIFVTISLFVKHTNFFRKIAKTITFLVPFFMFTLTTFTFRFKQKKTIIPLNK